MTPNSVQKLKDAFGCPSRPVSNLEFMEFWKSLTEAEKDYYRSLTWADLYLPRY
jgi:hypothetical protein